MRARAALRFHGGLLGAACVVSCLRSAVPPAAPPTPVASPPTLALAAVEAPAMSESPGSLAAQAQQAWAQRGNRAFLERAILLWEQSLAGAPTDAQAAMQLTRAYYFMGDAIVSTEADTALAIFEKGVVMGERALMAASPELQTRVKAGEKIEDALRVVPPEGQQALYWYATNLGRFALAKGFTTMLFYKDRILAVMLRVLVTDETYFYGAPHRYLGAFYAKVPSFVGGDLKKAKGHFDKALAINANFFATKVLYAEGYATRAEDRPLFSKLLGEVRDADVNILPDVVPEQRLEQEKAKRLLARVDDLF